MSKITPKVWISYSWNIKERVVELAKRLRQDGIDADGDFWGINAGNDIFKYMESRVLDPTIDKVLIICDRAYCVKADNREGGVGNETTIMTPKIYGKSDQKKFIPVVFEFDEKGDPYLPAYILSRYYINMTESNYENGYKELVLAIYEKPRYLKPELGKAPDWLDNPEYQYNQITDLLSKVQNLRSSDEITINHFLSQIKEELVREAQKYLLPANTQDEKTVLETIDKTIAFRDTFVNVCLCLINKGIGMGPFITSLFEKMNCELYSAKSHIPSVEYAVIHYILWESFILATALLLHFERYEDLKKILIHVYFVKFYYNYKIEIAENSYVNIMFNLFFLDDYIKQTKKAKGKLSLIADILVSRGGIEGLTKEEIINADIILYQMSRIHFNKHVGLWRAYTYVYSTNNELTMWRKLISMEFCNQVLPLFAAKDVSELKTKIEEATKINTPPIYEHSDSDAPWITDVIDIYSIGTKH